MEILFLIVIAIVVFALAVFSNIINISAPLGNYADSGLEKIEGSAEDSVLVPASIKSVDEIYQEFLDKNPDIKKYDPKLASGWPRDSKGPGTSDVDIVIYLENGSVDDVKNVKFNIPMNINYDDEKKRAIYTPSDNMGREVNVYVSANPAVMRSVKHAENEKILCDKFPKLAEKVMELKKSGIKTEPAWVQVLNLGEVDPYEAMLASSESLIEAAAKSPDLKEDGLTGGDIDPKNLSLFTKPESFEALKSGKKTIETRAGTLDKWGKFKGKNCEFINTETKESLNKKIVDVKHYKTIELLLKSEPVDKVMPGKTKEEALYAYDKFYPADLIEKRGGICAMYLE